VLPCVIRSRKSRIASVIGGFVGGCYAGLMGCKLVAMSGLGVFALAGFLSSDIMNFVNYVIAVVIAMVVTFAITFVTFKDEA
jgi:PTS system beta-glucosides-specific IIC component